MGLKYSVKVVLVIIAFMLFLIMFVTWLFLTPSHHKFLGPTHQEKRIELRQKGFNDKQIDSIIKEDDDELTEAILMG